MTGVGRREWIIHRATLEKMGELGAIAAAIKNLGVHVDSPRILRAISLVGPVANSGGAPPGNAP